MQKTHRALRVPALLGLIVLAACVQSPDDRPLAFSTTWTSDDTGWVLAAHANCSSTCRAVLLATADGGRSWQEIDGTRPRLELDRWEVELEPHLRFANERDGWMVTPDLWSTHDGGATWEQVDLPGRVLALETADGAVHAIVLEQDTLRMSSSEVGSDEFTTSPPVLPWGGVATPRVDLALAGGRGWSSVREATSTAVASLRDGVWTESAVSCRSERAAVFHIAASSAEDVVALCDERFSDDTGFHLYASDDGGATFPRELPLPNGNAYGAVYELVRRGSSMLIVTLPGDNVPMATTVTSDDGATWTEPVDIGDVPLQDLVFTSPDRGVAIASHHLLATDDGGLTWTEVLLPPI